jgi:hypothetical protein
MKNNDGHIRMTLILALTTFLLLPIGCGGSDGASSGDDYAPATESYYESTGDESSPDSEYGSSDVEGGEILTGNFLLQRVTYDAWGGSTSSIECYTLYDDGQAELRHSAVLSDTGSYSGDTTTGEIMWESGRTTTIEWNGSAYEFNSVEASNVGSC